MDPRRYGPFPFTPITRRPKLEWPNGARIAIWVIPNIEIFNLDVRMPPGPGSAGDVIPDVHMWAIRDYGSRVGVWRVMEVLGKYGIRGTVALNGEVCDGHPEIVEEALRLDWELMGHNMTNTHRLNQMSPENERDAVRATFARIGEAAGKRPAGWLSSGLQESWHTLDYLIDEGCRYIADWVNDDQPYTMDVDGRQIVSIPYSSEINDKPAFEYHHVTPDEFAAMIVRQFDVLYREGGRSGRVMAIALHPYIIGVPHRIDALDKALRHVTSHDDVWLATGSEIVEHFVQAHTGL